MSDFNNFYDNVTRVGVMEILRKKADGETLTDEEVELLKTEFTKPEIWHEAENTGIFDTESSPKYTITYKFGDDVVGEKEVVDGAGDGYVVTAEDIASITKEGEGYGFTFSTWKNGTKNIKVGQTISGNVEWKAGTCNGNLTAFCVAGDENCTVNSNVNFENLTSYGAVLSETDVNNIKGMFVPVEGYVMDTFKVGEDDLVVGMEFKESFTVTGYSKIQEVSEIQEEQGGENGGTEQGVQENANNVEGEPKE